MIFQLVCLAMHSAIKRSIPAPGDDVAGDFAEGAPCAAGGKRLVPPLLLDIPGRVYEPPLDTPTPCAHMPSPGTDRKFGSSAFPARLQRDYVGATQYANAASTMQSSTTTSNSLPAAQAHNGAARARPRAPAAVCAAPGAPVRAR